MKEILTVQVGGFANFIGSHFWNLQDELLGLADDPNSDPLLRDHHLNMDVLYRTGETLQGTPTYTPRVLSVDLQGSLGSMSSRGTLYNDDRHTPSDVVTWAGNFSTHTSEPHKKNIFLQSLDEEQDNFSCSNGISNGDSHSQRKIHDQEIVASLENDVQFWTDFSKVHYHPQSLYELSGLWTDAQEFDNYGIGRDVFSGVPGEEINERLRFFAEECDHIQGFQFIVDDSGGFSALAGDFLENIADEYSNTPVLLYTVRDSRSYIKQRTQKHAVARVLHDAISFSRLSSFCKLIVPVGLPVLSQSKASTFLHIQDDKPYHCSAVYAAALHSISLPFRMEQSGPLADSRYVSGAVDVNGVVQMLAGQARQNNVAILDVAMPAPPLNGNQVEQSLIRNLHPLTPEIAEDVEDMQAVESITCHGALSSGGGRASISEVKAGVHTAYEHELTRPMFCHISAALCPLPIPLPFPSLFGNLVGQNGELLGSSVSGPSPKGLLDIHSIPMAARLRSSSAVLPYLENRLGNLRKFGTARGAPGSEIVRSWGIGKDDLDEVEEALFGKVSLLNPRSELSSDSD
ncbi:protein misato 1 isoform X1 [Tripterygium wilfordii]|uniref:Protein misato 1 isoform X1 n=1 Tax=Tripterygium wilfordii TaxID=458696 RepID=A0A7J7CPX3_TRIWF|nr:protein misato homolog 1 [Tripterygium wilfordii]KAF5736114.1 protein misato 1 isoform X1 [Tripterygium wilfordii]